jgi:ribosome-associated protein
MLDALSKAVLEQIREKESLKGHPEGYPKDGWLVIDYGDVVVHLLSPDQREYYNLEELWEQGKILLRVQ